VRRSRERFWSEDKTSADKLDAYWTLYECLLTTARLIAPFVPFLAEAMWQNLAVAAFGTATPSAKERRRAMEEPPHPGPLPQGEGVRESVHLCDFPAPDEGAIDEGLSARMNLAREIVSLGRSARMGAKLKVRQPLAKVEVILADRAHEAWLKDHSALIAEELNVKRVEFAEKADQYISYSVLPDLKRLGPRLGKQLPELRKALAAADASALLAQMETEQSVSLELPSGAVKLDAEDLQIRLQAKEGWAAAQSATCVVVLSTELDEALVAEGLAREVVHAIQSARKDRDCEYTDRIETGFVTEEAPLREAVERFGDYVRRETLTERLEFGPLAGVEPIELNLAGRKARLYVRTVSA
jgi:isoleucyl-tRNA synthetase